MTHATPPETCPSCGQEIDPDTCPCGASMTSDWHDYHTPIPMGCDSGRADPDEFYSFWAQITVVDDT